MLPSEKYVELAEEAVKMGVECTHSTEGLVHVTAAVALASLAQVAQAREDATRQRQIFATTRRSGGW